MAQRALEATIRYIRRVSACQHNTLDDRQLLKAFSSHGNGDAFATLIDRHGKMVLGVCQRVLGNRTDAEDVFQATFLVLARKAGTMRWRPSIGLWLSAVAYRLAKKVSVEESRRRSIEPRGSFRASPEPVAEIALRELQSVVDEEIQRLPEKLRAPVLLCYLGGKSNEAAAGELGFSVTTIKGRLARARTLLRTRLTRRGLGLGLGLALPGLDEPSATAAVPGTLAHSTTKLAALCRAGESVAVDMVPAKVAALANSAFKVSWIGSVSLVTGFALMITAAAAGAGLLLNRVAERGSSAIPAYIANADNGDGTVSTVPLVHLSASGTVTDEQEKPITGAKVYLREMGFMRDSRETREKNYSDILSQTATDAGGRFVFKDVAAQNLARPGNIYQHPWEIVVQAKGRGMVWRQFRSNEEPELTLEMGPEARIQGRLLDEQSKPVAGVIVTVQHLDDQLEPENRYQTSARNTINLRESKLRLTTTTDANGRFVINGMPREHCIGMITRHPRFARKWLSFATIDKSRVDSFNALVRLPEGLAGRIDPKLLADGFTVNLEASHSIQGQIVYGDTGNPATGAGVWMNGMAVTFTDNQGRYSFEGLEARKHHLTVEPPENADYLRNSAEVIIKAGTLQQQQDFTLVRGSLIVGQLREKESKVPIRTPGLTIYFRQADNPKPGGFRFFGYSRTKPDGSYRIVVSPGRGRLFTSDSPSGFVSTGAMDLEEEPIDSEVIEIKSGETLEGKDFFLEKGMTVQGRLLDPNGRPVPGARFLGARSPGITEQSRSAEDGSYKLVGLSREQSSQFLVVQRMRGLGTRLTVEPRKSPGPIQLDVVLQPTQTATGRVIDEKNRPVANALVELSVSILLYMKGNMASFGSHPLEVPVRTDAEGKYKYSALPVNGRFTVTASARNFAAVEGHFRVERGVDPKIPDLVLQSKGLSLAGVVVDQAGNPIKDAEVWIQRRFPRGEIIHILASAEPVFPGFGGSRCESFFALGLPGCFLFCQAVAL